MYIRIYIYIDMCVYVCAYVYTDIGVYLYACVCREKGRIETVRENYMYKLSFAVSLTLSLFPYTCM